jgi:hypothetical protein
LVQIGEVSLSCIRYRVTAKSTSGALGHRYLFAEGFPFFRSKAIRRAGIRSRKKSPAEAGLQKAGNFQNLRLVPQMELGQR